MRGVSPLQFSRRACKEKRSERVMITKRYLLCPELPEQHLHLAELCRDESCPSGPMCGTYCPCEDFAQTGRGGGLESASIED